MDLPLPCKETRDLEGHQGAVRAARFNYDGNYCLTCGSDKLLKLWNPHKGTLLKTYSGHGYEVLDAVGSSDNSRVVSCGGDKTVVQWDVATGQILRRFRGHTSVSVQVAITICIDYLKGPRPGRADRTDFRLHVSISTDISKESGLVHEHLYMQ